MLNVETLTLWKIKNKKIIFSIIGIFFSLLTSIFSYGSAQDWAACGIPDAAPMSCVHCKRVCACDLKGRCLWIWIKK